MIEVTDVKIYPFDVGDDAYNVKAYADVTLAGCLTLKGVRVMETRHGGLFISFPSQRGRRDGEFRDLIVPETAEFKAYLRDQVVAVYKEAVGWQPKDERDPPEGG